MGEGNDESLKDFSHIAISSMAVIFRKMQLKGLVEGLESGLYTIPS